MWSGAVTKASRVFFLPQSTLGWWGLLLPSHPPLLFLGGGVDLGVAALYERIFIALVWLVVENGANYLLAGGEVGGSVEQLVGINGSASHELMHQIPARRTLEESVNDLDVGDAGESVHCLEKRRT